MCPNPSHDSDEQPKAGRRPEPAACELCGRAQPLTFHHLIPKKLHTKRAYRRSFSKQALDTHGLYLCRDCHNKVHKTFSLKELAEAYNTREALLNTDAIQRFIRWVRKKKRPGRAQ
jgi:formate-dependent nitrite reductase cytochrome c552 subunit